MRFQKRIAFILAVALFCVLFMPHAVNEASAPEGVDACGLRGWDPDAGYQYVIMGYYPYEADGTEAPVLWQVLSIEDGKALLYTTNIIDAHQPVEVTGKQAEKHDYPEISDYGDTDLNRWLNEVMIDKLLGDEPVLAAVTEEQYGRLYPLTDFELMTEKYGFTNQRFYEVRSRWAYATPYALSVKLYPDYGSRIQKDTKYGTSGYWVAALKRNNKTNEQIPGRYLQICAGIADPHKPKDSNIGHLSFGYLNRTSIGLRLAVRLDTSRIQVISGNGTIWDPCRLALTGETEEGVKEAVTPPLRSAPTPVPTTPAPVRGRPTIAPPGPDAPTPVPVPEWAGEYTDDNRTAAPDGQPEDE